MSARGAAVVAVIMLAAVNGAHGQTGRRFDGAAIRPNTSNPGVASVAPQSGGRYVAVNATAMMLISSAYEIREYQVMNAPGWTSTEHYDVQAIGDVSALDDVRARRDALNEMARNLLTDRFHLAAHREKRPIEVYALTLAGRDGKLGPSLTVSQVDCDSRPIGRDRPPAQLTIDDFNKPPACGIRGSATSWFAGGEKIDSLVTELSNDLHAPVTDHTNLTRRYTISLRWSVDAASATSDTPPLPVALEQQLGLRLERRKEPLDVLVIDQIERPTTD